MHREGDIISWNNRLYEILKRNKTQCIVLEYPLKTRIVLPNQTVDIFFKKSKYNNNRLTKLLILEQK